ncbi:hypothetical protein HDU67_003249 [Dinochytrium kinnereticum]|nr:hypothetical protein HDU67_003249 [Dinochytrium kinnereticum]
MNTSSTFAPSLGPVHSRLNPLGNHQRLHRLAGDVSMAAVRDMSLLHSLVNQATTASSTLVTQFKVIVKRAKEGGPALVICDSSCGEGQKNGCCKRSNNRFSDEATVVPSVGTSDPHLEQFDPAQRLASLLKLEMATAAGFRTTFKDQWSAVKTLCETIAALLEGSSVAAFNVEVNPYLFSLDSIVEQLCAGTRHIESYEYNFLFLALHLSSNLKATAGRYTENGALKLYATTEMPWHSNQQPHALPGLAPRSASPLRNGCSGSKRTSEAYAGYDMQDCRGTLAVKDHLLQLESSESRKSLEKNSAVAGITAAEETVSAAASEDEGNLMNGTSPESLRELSHSATRHRRHSIGHAPPPSPLPHDALSSALSPTSATTALRRMSLLQSPSFSGALRDQGFIDSESFTQAAMKYQISYDGWNARYQMGLQALGREASATVTSIKDSNAITKRDGDPQLPTVVPILTSSSSYPELRNPAGAQSPRSISEKRKDGKFTLHPLQIAFRADDDAKEEDAKDEDEKDEDAKDEDAKDEDAKDEDEKDEDAKEKDAKEDHRMDITSPSPLSHQYSPMRDDLESTRPFIDPVQSPTEMAMQLNRDPNHHDPRISPSSIHPESVYRSSKSLGTALQKRELMEFTTVILLPLSDSFPTALHLNLVHVQRFGRGSGYEVRDGVVEFSSKVVSRTHAEIFVKDDVVYLQDIGSQGGTFVNSVRLSQPGGKSECFELRTGDIVQLGQDLSQDRLASSSVPSGLDHPLVISGPQIYGCVKMQVVLVPGQRALSKMGETSIEKSTPSSPSTDDSMKPLKSLSEESLAKSLTSLSRSTSVASLSSFRLSADPPASLNSRARLRPKSVKLRGVKEEMILNKPIPAPIETLRRLDETKLAYDDASSERSSASTSFPTSSSFTSLSPSDSTSSAHLGSLEKSSSQHSSPLKSSSTSSFSLRTIFKSRRRSSASKTSLKIVERPMKIWVPPDAEESRVGYTFWMSTVGRRVKEMHATTAGWFGNVLEVDLKRWSKKRAITIRDVRPRYSTPHIIRIFPEISNKDRFTVTVEPCNPLGSSSPPKTVGTLFFDSSTKVLIEAKPLPPAFSEEPTINDLANPPSVVAGYEPIPILQYSMTGDLQNYKFVVVRHQPENRSPEIIGDVSGKVTVRKNVREVKGACQVGLVDAGDGQGPLEQLMFAGLCFVFVGAEVYAS